MGTEEIEKRVYFPNLGFVECDTLETAEVLRGLSDTALRSFYWKDGDGPSDVTVRAREFVDGIEIYQEPDSVATEGLSRLEIQGTTDNSLEIAQSREGVTKLRSGDLELALFHSVTMRI